MTATTATTIRATPHPGQAQVHNSPARFKVLSAGRRWGKTRLGVMECFDTAAHGGRAWWIAPSYKISEVGWRPIRNIGSRIGAEVRRGDRQVILPNGGEIAVRSADNPDSLRGEIGSSGSDRSSICGVRRPPAVSLPSLSPVSSSPL